MWIFLIKKLPTAPSPPKMSIFWSVPFPDDTYAKEQLHTCQNCNIEIYKGTVCDCTGDPRPTRPDDMYGESERGNVFPGFEANWVGARKIHYAGHDVRIFPHEFSRVTPENMRAYVVGTDHEDPSHELVTEEVAADTLRRQVLDGDSRPLYDFALCEGATPAQAMAVALGSDITFPDVDFPPIGWYRIKPEIGLLFCEDYELSEDRRTESDLLGGSDGHARHAATHSQTGRRHHARRRRQSAPPA